MPKHTLEGHDQQEVKSKNSLGLKETFSSSLKSLGAYCLHNQYVVNGLRILGTSGFVAVTLSPIEIALSRRQLGKKVFTIFTEACSNPSVRWALRQHLKNAGKGSVLKNFAIASHRDVTAHVDHYLGEKPSKGNRSFVNQYKITFITSGLIASIDTMFTQYYANFRVFNSLGKGLNLSLNEKLKLTKEGLIIRGMRNYVGTLACLSATSIISDFTNRYTFISGEENPVLHNIFTSIIAGLTMAPLINILDVVYRSKISKMNFNRFTTPSSLEVSKQLWNEGGYSPFLRGTSLSCLYTVVAVSSINLCSQMLDYVFLDNSKEEKSFRLSQSRATLFPAKSDLELIKDEAEEAKGLFPLNHE